jgi:hypothetical protein
MMGLDLFDPMPGYNGKLGTDMAPTPQAAECGNVPI